MPGNKGLLKNSTALQPQIGLPKILGYGSGLPLAGPSLVNYLYVTQTSGMWQCQVVSGKPTWVSVSGGSAGGGGGGVSGAGTSGNITKWISNTALGNSQITESALLLTVTAAAGTNAVGSTGATSGGAVFIIGGSGGAGDGSNSGFAAVGGTVTLQGGQGGANYSGTLPTPTAAVGGTVYVLGGTGGTGSGLVAGSGGNVFIQGGIPSLSGLFNQATAGNVYVLGGAASGGTGYQGGAVFIDGGPGASVNGTVNIGSSNAVQIVLGNTSNACYQTITNTQLQQFGQVFIGGISGSFTVLDAAVTIEPTGPCYITPEGSGSFVAGTTLALQGNFLTVVSTADNAGSNQSGCIIKGGKGSDGLSGFFGGINGGIVAIIGGQGGAGQNSGYAGASGALVSITGGQGGTGGTSGQGFPGQGGNLTVTAGQGGTLLSGAGGGANGGNVTLDAGLGTGTGTAGTVNIGTTNATAITIGRSGTTTTINGILSANAVTNLTSGAVVVGTGSSGLSTVAVGIQGQLLVQGNTGPTWLSGGTSGQPHISQGSGSLPIFGILGVVGGGTGNASFSGSLNELLATGSTATGALQAISGGTVGQYLTFVSGGLPQWGNLSVTVSGAVTFCNDFRLTAYSGIGVTTSDITLAGTLYMVPKSNVSGLLNTNGGVITLYNLSGSWGNYQATSVSQSLAALASGTAYDAYAFYSGSAIALKTTAWSNTSTPPARALQDGQLVVSGSPQYRYVGSFYANGSGTTEDSVANRYIWNYYNREVRQMQYISSASSWTYSGTAAWRQGNNNSAYQVNCMLGMDIDVITARVHVPYQSTAAANLGVGVGIDGTTVNVAQIFGCTISAAGGAETNGYWTGHAGIGRHSINWLEYGYGGSTLTFYSTGFGLPFSAGITGEVWA